MPKHSIPEHWTLKSEEVAPYNFRVRATATDGRVIEMGGPDEERMIEQVVLSISVSDAQVAELKRQPEANGVER